MPVRGPDTRIPLMGVPVQMPDILGSMGRVAQMKRLEAISQQEQQEMALKQKALEDDAKVQAIFAQPGMTVEKAIPLLFQIDAPRALEFEKAVIAKRNAQLSGQNTELDIAKKMTAQQQDELFAATIKKYGGFTPEAEADLMAAIPERTATYKNLLRQSQGTFQQADVVIDGKTQKATFNPASGKFEPSGFEAAGSVDDARAAAQFNESMRHNRVMENKPTGTDNALVAIVGPDGKPVLVPRSQAVGKTPASTRDSGGGRGVTSGDANRIADFDTSLDDVAVLRKTISGNKATGTKAAIGAALWNPITEATGIGAEAKSKQAVIDRVKQVIGKALEGGVLRKEDEYKYTKILPTISDPTSLVISKLDGLESALKQRKSTLIDSLDDAGYNTDAYKNRVRPGATDTTKDAGGVERWERGPDGKPRKVKP